MATARDIIESALREIGVLAEGEAASSSGASTGLTRLNRFIDRLNTERLAVYTVTRTAGLTITANDGEYSVGGSGADWNVGERPVYIDRIGFIDTDTDPDTEYSMHRLTEQEYQNITQKARTSAFPQAYYYNPTMTTATITLWPVPTDANLEGVVYHWAQLSQLSSLDATVSLPPGYEEMLVTNLALLLCPSYSRTPHPVLVETARKSLSDVKRRNIRQAELGMEATLSFPSWGDHGRGQYGRYDIFQG